MMVVRREVLSMLAGGVAAVAVNTRSLAASINGARSVTKQLPSFELQGTPTSLASLRTDVAAYSMVRGGSATFAVWLKCKDGRVLFMGVDQREPLPMFEVFTLAIATMDELKARWRDWKPPTLPDDMPEPFRTFVTARPAAPTAPADFEPWPFDQWQTQVLRRAEFIVEDVPIGGAFGNNPNMQSAARPMSVPPEASASCEVAAGVLFTGANGKRLLIGVDWMPENMVVTDTPAKIDQYLQPCERVELTTYLERLSKRP
jgi:hypothetical protein